MMKRLSFAGTWIAFGSALLCDGELRRMILIMPLPLIVTTAASIVSCQP